MFASEPYTEREAWLWLLGAAAWKSGRIRVGKAIVEVTRGQLAFATRFLAVKWQWAHSRVVRFLKRLETDTMIRTQTTRVATLITICNYDEYQFNRNAAALQTETPSDTQPERGRNKEEELKKDNNKEEKKETRASALDDWPSDFREQFWETYPHKVGKANALRILERIRKRAVLVSWDVLMDGLQNYIRTKPPDRPWCNPATWLNQDRWTDQPANVSKDNGKTGDIIAAADNLVSIIDSFGGGTREGDGIRGQTGPPHVRLLSQG